MKGLKNVQVERAQLFMDVKTIKKVMVFRSTVEGMCPKIY